MTENRSEITSTELVWPGKRTEVDRVVLPFQTVETVNKPRVDQPRFDLGGPRFGCIVAGVRASSRRRRHLEWRVGG